MQTLKLSKSSSPPLLVQHTDPTTNHIENSKSVTIIGDLSITDSQIEIGFHGSTTGTQKPCRLAIMSPFPMVNNNPHPRPKEINANCVGIRDVILKDDGSGFFIKKTQGSPRFIHCSQCSRSIILKNININVRIFFQRWKI